MKKEKKYGMEDGRKPKKEMMKEKRKKKVKTHHKIYWCVIALHFASQFQRFWRVPLCQRAIQIQMIGNLLENT